MSIQIEETFQVEAPVETVWRFLLDPHRVVQCMPGAELEEVADEHTFEGSVQVKLGAITTRYRGRVHLAEVDDEAHRVRMRVDAREPGGGTLLGGLTSELRALPDGGTEVLAQAQVDLTGRVVQMGRGMIQGVSRELFAQFAERMRETLARPADAPADAIAPRSEPIPIFRVLMRVLWAPIARLLRRIFQREAI